MPAVRLFAALALAVTALGACAAFQQKTFGESLDEASAATQIRTRLLASGGPNHFGEVDVEVEGRFVLLSGRVPSEDDRRTAEKIAWDIKLVDEVANELVIEPRNVKRDVNDVWIGQQVRARLFGDRHVAGVNYNVQVYDGVVYLLGLAGSQEEMQKAAEDASVVKGVAKVVSYVKVRPRGNDRMRAVETQSAQAQAPLQSVQPQPVQAPAATRVTSASGAIQIAPASDTPAPIVPDKQATTRQSYADPYGPGAAPPPGRASNQQLTTQPLPPVQQ